MQVQLGKGSIKGYCTWTDFSPPPPPLRCELNFGAVSVTGVLAVAFRDLHIAAAIASFVQLVAAALGGVDGMARCGLPYPSLSFFCATRPRPALLVSIDAVCCLLLAPSSSPPPPHTHPHTDA